jgi:hypothetical protein
MGWCSGTQLFDMIVDILLEEQKDIKMILKQIISEFEMMDWDCESDSKHWDTPIVKQAFKELHPNWFEEEDQ